MLLVVGAVPNEVHTTACHRMLGDACETRRRLFVETDTTCGDIVDRLPAARPDPTPGTVRRITNPSYARSAAAQPTAEDLGGIPVRRLDSTDLSELGTTIADEIGAFERATGGFAPSELRLCFDSLLPLIDEHDQEHVFRFLHVLSGLVRDANGQAHFHLPIDVDDPAVRTLAPVFDAVVELGIDRGEPRQRWHLRGVGRTSEWLPLRSDG